MSFDATQSHKRMMIVYLFLAIVVGAGIMFRLWKIQVSEGDHWRKEAKNREAELQEDPAQRGTIYSSDNQILATTIPVCDLYLDLTKHIKTDEKGKKVRDSRDRLIIESTIAEKDYRAGIQQVCQLLADAETGHDYNYYYSRINDERSKRKPSGCYLIARQIPYSTWEAICHVKGWNLAVCKSVMKEGGAESVKRQIRAHIYNNLAENVIGFRNSFTSQSYTGLEGYYDSILRGQDGLFLCRRLTRGMWIEESRPGTLLVEGNDTVTIGAQQTRERIDGSDIIATIDTRYQDIAETSLRKTLNKYGALSGCAILMEVETGYVLACSNLYLDTASKTYIEMPNRNIACSDLYEPGSTFKSAIMTAYLNDRTLNLDTASRYTNKPRVYSRTSGEINDGRHVALTPDYSVPEIMAHSSNVGMCEIGWNNYRDRRDTLKNHVLSIFPHDVLNLDLKTNEPKGKVQDLKPDRNFLNFCYGYNINLTAMQLITFYNALAGGGRMVKPLFCKGIITKGKLRPIDPVVINDSICSPEVAKKMKDMLVGVVENGTGRNIASNTYGIAGKTGTARYAYNEDKDIYTASFAGFFPAEKPKYTCLVIVKRVLFHGSQAAAPVFKDIADCVMAQDKEMGYVMLKGQDSTSLKKVKSATTNRTPVARKARRNDVSRAYRSLGISSPGALPNSEWLVWDVMEDSTGVHERYINYEVPEGKIPNCNGMTIRDAIRLLSSMGYKAKFTGYGRVVEQSPRHNTPAKEGATVTLRLAN